jgi:hypothetical protein
MKGVIRLTVAIAWYNSGNISNLLTSSYFNNCSFNPLIDGITTIQPLASAPFSFEVEQWLQMWLWLQFSIWVFCVHMVVIVIIITIWFRSMSGCWWHDRICNSNSIRISITIPMSVSIHTMILTNHGMQSHQQSLPYWFQRTRIRINQISGASSMRICKSSPGGIPWFLV